jgi:hypothetical protein
MSTSKPTRISLSEIIAHAGWIDSMATPSAKHSVGKQVIFSDRRFPVGWLQGCTIRGFMG